MVQLPLGEVPDAPAMDRRFKLDILPQPDDATCGPTCLHAVYRFYGDEVSLPVLIDEIPPLKTGGTLNVVLACHALRRGYRATIYTYNLRVFDPTWFRPGVDIRERLKQQMLVKTKAKLHTASEGYREFLSLGGKVLFEDLTPDLIRAHLRRGRPILTGLSSTYLYGCSRERLEEPVYDDILGVPMGHFVVLFGMKRGKVLVADPLQDNPLFGRQHYSVPIQRVINAVMLSIVTYDASLLIIEPVGANDVGADRH